MNPDTTAAVSVFNSPEQLRSLFDTYWIMFAVLFGIVVKYIPPKFVLGLSKISNDAIGWMNFLIYVAGHVATALVGTARAQGDSTSVLAVGAPGLVESIPGIISVLLGAFTTTGWARTFYEALGRPFLEGFLRRKKVPSPPKAVSASPSQGG